MVGSPLELVKPKRGPMRPPIAGAWLIAGAWQKLQVSILKLSASSQQLIQDMARSSEVTPGEDADQTWESVFFLVAPSHPLSV